MLHQSQAAGLFLGMLDAGLLQYPSSSYRANGLGQPDSLLTSHPLYLELGRDEAETASTNTQLSMDIF